MLMFYCLCFKYIYLCTKFNVKQKNLFIYGKGKSKA